MQKLPEVIEFVSDKILNDKALYDEIKKFLMDHIKKINNDSMHHSSFCSALKKPNNIVKTLLKIFDVSDKQCLSAFAEIGFHPESRMYGSLYYQTLILVYYIGLRAGDDLLRIVSLTLLYVKIFNGRQYRYMPNGCQEDIAQYLIQSKFRASHTFKKYPSPFVSIHQYWAPSLDQKYHAQVLKDPANPTKGLMVILMQAWGRMDQTFMGIQKHYYAAHYSGKKFGISANAIDGKGQETDGTELNKITSTVDKLQKNMLSNRVKLSPKDILYLKKTYSVSDKFLDDAIEFLDDEQNEDDIQNIYELLFTITQTDSSKMCGLNVIESVHKLTSTKGNDKQIVNLKKYVDSMLNLMYKGMMKNIGSSSKLKLRKVLLLIITLRGKKAFCKAEF